MEDSLEDYIDEETARLLQRYESERESGKYGFYDVDEYVSLIGIQMLYTDLHRALQTLRIAREQYPEAVELKLKHAELCLEMGFLDQALGLLEEVEKIESSLYDIHIIRGHVLRQQFKYGEAREAFLKARENGADEVDVAMGLAEIELAENNPPKAWEHIQHILGSEEDTAETCNRFIDLVQKAQMLPEAIGFVRDLLKKYPYTVLYWKLLAELSELAGCYEQALEADEFVLAIAPDERETLFHKFKVLENIDSDKNQLDFYLKMETWAEDMEMLASVWLRIAQEYELDENWNRAGIYYRRLLDFPDTRAYAFFRLGVIANYMLDFSNALVFFFQALESTIPEEKKQENTAKIYRGMARTFYYMGRPAEMMEYNKLAIGTEPDNRFHLYAYVLDACDTGEAETAEEYVDQALGKGSSGALWLAKACILYYTGRKEEAYGYFARAFATDHQTRNDADNRIPDIFESDFHVLELRNAYTPHRDEQAFEDEEPYLYYGPDEQYLHDTGIIGSVLPETPAAGEEEGGNETDSHDTERHGE